MRHPFYIFKGLGAALIAVTLLVPIVSLNSQIETDAPIEGFRVNMFGDDGGKLWKLKGDIATRQESGVVDMEGLDLVVYSKEVSGKVDFKMISENAHYMDGERAVSGEGGVEFYADTYTITGDKWKYEEEGRVIRIKENVRVVLEYEMEAFLK